MNQKINTDASIIGYWARVHGLDLQDVIHYDELSDYVDGPDEQREFRRGWNQADDELLYDKFDRLMVSLRDMGPMPAISKAQI